MKGAADLIGTSLKNPIEPQIRIQQRQRVVHLDQTNTAGQMIGQHRHFRISLLQSIQL